MRAWGGARRGDEDTAFVGEESFLATVRVFCFTHHVAASRRRRDFRRERERRTPRIPPRSVRAIESNPDNARHYR